jgi:hypothetical protein
VDALSCKGSAENMLEDQHYGVTRVERLVKLSHAILTSLIARILAVVLVLRSGPLGYSLVLDRLSAFN